MDDYDKELLDRFYDMCKSQIRLLVAITGDKKEACAAVYELLGILLDEVEDMIYPDDEEN